MHCAITTYDVVQLLGEPTLTTPGPMSNDREHEAHGKEGIQHVGKDSGSLGHGTTRTAIAITW
jgi:hypothetical protein